ncbi:MAG: class I SAM-dependent methyltransferase [Verrucomicrobiae bacterium]|nr:class I SAM-dependent methyltransferase [Verrucomicrobiae bacterium]
MLLSPSASPEKIKWMARHAPSATGAALDLGCGAGIYSQTLKKQGWAVAAIDQVPPVSAQAIGFLQHDLEKGLPFPDHQFDLVLAWDVLEHLDNETAMWTAIQRVLRPGGVLLGSVPHGDDDRLAPYNLAFKHHIDRTHRRTYLPANLKERLLSHDMEIMAMELKGPVSPQVLAEFIPWPVLRMPIRKIIGLARRLGLLAFQELYADIFWAARKRV